MCVSTHTRAHTHSPASDTILYCEYVCRLCAERIPNRVVEAGNECKAMNKTNTRIRVVATLFHKNRRQTHTYTHTTHFAHMENNQRSRPSCGSETVCFAGQRRRQWVMMMIMCLCIVYREVIHRVITSYNDEPASTRPISRSVSSGSELYRCDCGCCCSCCCSWI